MVHEGLARFVQRAFAVAFVATSALSCLCAGDLDFDIATASRSKDKDLLDRASVVCEGAQKGIACFALCLPFGFVPFLHMEA